MGAQVRAIRCGAHEPLRLRAALAAAACALALATAACGGGGEEAAAPAPAPAAGETAATPAGDLSGVAFDVRRDPG